MRELTPLGWEWESPPPTHPPTHPPPAPLTRAQVRIEHASGSIELTPDHILPLDGVLAPASEAKVPPPPY